MTTFQNAVVRRIELVCQRSPDSAALASADGTVTYFELAALSEQFCAVLKDRAVNVGDLIGICIPRSFIQIAVMLAIWKIGATAVLLDPAWPSNRINRLAAKVGCHWILKPGSEWRGIRVAFLDEAPDDTEAASAGAAQPADVAYVIFTSGSTGEPKGVAISHLNLENLIDWHLGAFQVTDKDRGSHLAGLGFDASIWEVWPYLCAGASVHLVDDVTRRSGHLLRDWFLDHDITVAFVPTALVPSLLEQAWPEATALRYLLAGGEQLLVRPSAGLPFTLVNNYGPTECTVVATSAIVAPRQATEDPPIGWPIANTFIHILDENRLPVSAGRVGEIHIGGANVGLGYIGEQGDKDKRFVADPFSAVPGARMFCTGDLGTILPDGQIAFQGRKDDAVKILGNRVNLAEVTAALVAHPLVRDAVTVARSGANGAMQLVVYLVMRPRCEVTHADLRQFLGLTLPDFMLPALFVTLDAMPLTPSGKIDRAALPEPGDANTLGAVAFLAADTPAEAMLVDILAEVLGRSVGVRDNFFLIGGHSLLGTQVVLKAADAFGVQLSLRDLFLAPTIQQLAKVVEAKVMNFVQSMSDDEVLKYKVR